MFDFSSTVFSDRAVMQRLLCFAGGQVIMNHVPRSGMS